MSENSEVDKVLGRTSELRMSLGKPLTALNHTLRSVDGQEESRLANGSRIDWRRWLDEAHHLTAGSTLSGNAAAAACAVTTDDNVFSQL